MIEEFEYQGIWWLPEKPEDRVSGTLKYNPIGLWPRAVLDLNGSFEDEDEQPRREIILGITSNGRKITLHGCYHSISTTSIPGYKISSYIIDRIYIGTHFLKPEDIRFRSVSVRYSYLEEWIGKRLFESQPSYEGNKFKGYRIEYRHPESVKMRVKDFNIGLVYRMSFSEDLYRAPELKSTSVVRVEPKVESSFEELVSIIYHIRNFLSLAMITTGKTISPLSVEGETEKERTMIREDRFVYSPIEIIWDYGESIVAPKEKEMLHWDILFRFSDIFHAGETYFNNWFAKSELLKPIYDLFFSTLYKPEMYITNQFLNLVQAIESYHRRTTQNYDLPPVEFERRMGQILHIIPEEWKEWLSGKMKYGNEPSLRKRLKEIIDSPELQEFFDNDLEAIELFVHKVVVTRNYLSHYDKSSEDEAVPPQELFRYVQRLRTILLVCLLKEIGFELDKVRLMTRKYYERYVQHLTLP